MEREEEGAAKMPDDVQRADSGDKVRRIFGARAATYTTSASHTDPEVLAWVVRCAKPEAHWTALDVATGSGHTAFAPSRLTFTPARWRSVRG